MENELSGRVGEMARNHLNRQPTYAFDHGGSLRVDVRGTTIRAASKIQSQNFAPDFSISNKQTTT